MLTLINANVEKRQRHSLKSVIEHAALTTHNNASEHWIGQHGNLNNNVEKIKGAVKAFKSGEYIDVHAWYFTPKSFSEIISYLNQLDYISLKLDRLQHTAVGGIEFYAVLEK